MPQFRKKRKKSYKPKNREGEDRGMTIFSSGALHACSQHKRVSFQQRIFMAMPRCSKEKGERGLGGAHLKPRVLLLQDDIGEGT